MSTDVLTCIPCYKTNGTNIRLWDTNDIRTHYNAFHQGRIHQNLPQWILDNTRLHPDKATE